MRRAVLRMPPQRGVSMIEALVAILIVSMGILALAGMMGTSARVAKTGELRATAALLAADMADRMRANQAGAAAAAYQTKPALLATALPTAPAACIKSTSPACTPAQLAALDLADWQAALYSQLPGGTGYIQMDTAADNTPGVMGDMWVLWRDPNPDDNDAAVAGLTRSACPPTFTAAVQATERASCLYLRVGK